MKQESKITCDADAIPAVDRGSSTRADHQAIVRHVLQENRRFPIFSGALLIILIVIVFTVCLFVGRYNTTPDVLMGAIAHGFLQFFIDILELPTHLEGIDYTIVNPIPVTWETNVDIVLWTVRLPRLLAVIFVGGGLAVAGANYQGVFRNPLVSEGILGVSAGASLGASIAILLQSSTWVISVAAFLGGIAAVSLTCGVSAVFKGNRTLILVLAGTVVGSLFSAGVSIVKYMAPTDTALPDITFWLMGSFAKVKIDQLLFVLPAITISVIILQAFCWKLNVLSLGDEEAQSLGVNTRYTRLTIIVFSTIITAVSVCICGMVGWVGMIIPQITRMIVGPDNRRLIPCSFAAGALFLMIVDTVCRTLLVTEIPVGIVTSLIGAPIFLVLLLRISKGWS